MNNNLKLKTLFLIFISLLLFGCVKNNNKPQTQENFKTYKNMKYGYQVDYPANYLLLEENDPIPGEDPEFFRIEEGDIMIIENKDSRDTSFFVSVIKSDKSFEEFIDEHRQIKIKNKDKYNVEFTEKEISAGENNTKVIQFLFKFVDMPKLELLNNTAHIESYFKSNNYYVGITSSCSIEFRNCSEISKIHNQILESYKTIKK